jgi:hypothetical protein
MQQSVLKVPAVVGEVKFGISRGCSCYSVLNIANSYYSYVLSASRLRRELG